MAHKTWGGMVKAVERTIAELDANGIASDEDQERFQAAVKSLNAELSACWTNPSDVLDAADLKHRLAEAYEKAMTGEAH